MNQIVIYLVLLFSAASYTTAFTRNTRSSVFINCKGLQNTRKYMKNRNNTSILFLINAERNLLPNHIQDLLNIQSSEVENSLQLLRPHSAFLLSDEVSISFLLL
jgi:hypothetical protein